MVTGPWDDIAARRDEARALAAQRREEIAPGASTRTAASGPLYGVDSDRADATKRRLKALALGPTLGLLLDTLARQVVADGVSSDRDDQGSARLWAPWEASGMPSRQTALWREALIDGAAYAAVLPSNGPAVLPLPASRIACDWGGAEANEWAAAAVVLRGDGAPWRYLTATEEVDCSTGAVLWSGTLQHCPVVRVAPYQALDGECESLVDRLRLPARRYIKTVHDRLLVQHHNSWRVRTATGLADPGTPEEAERQKALLEHGDVLTGGEGVQFGSLPETNLQSLLDAEKADLGTLAALASVPSWALSGSQLVNLSADALAEAKAAERAHLQSLTRAFGRPVCNLVRLCAAVDGRRDDSEDTTLSVDWRDTEARSLSQAADALGKLSQTLGVPAALLWDRIPGVSPSEAAGWREYADAHPDALTSYTQALAGADNPGKVAALEEE